jgi:hypothetical protein
MPWTKKLVFTLWCPDLCKTVFAVCHSLTPDTAMWARVVSCTAWNNWMCEELPWDVSQCWAALERSVRINSNVGVWISCYFVSELAMWQQYCWLSAHTQPPIQWLFGAFSAEVKWQEHEHGLSPPCSAEVQKEYSCISTPPYVFMALPSSYVTSWIQIKINSEPA